MAGLRRGPPVDRARRCPLNALGERETESERETEREKGREREREMWLHLCRARDWGEEGCNGRRGEEGDKEKGNLRRQGVYTSVF